MQLFSKKTVALAIMACASPLLFAQSNTSSVQLYGIVDAAYRHTNNEGAGADSSLNQMIGGGMSQSRWGINVKEDLGGGLLALANLENRVNADSGSVPSPFFQQSWVGLQSNSFGRIVLGRQYNVLFDLVSSTYVSFPYSPYMDAYKPELGLSMGSRADNMIKYIAEVGPIRGSLQYSFDENNTVSQAGAATNPAGARKTAGGYLRYAAGGIAAGAGYMSTTLPGGTKVDAWTLGGSYKNGPLYLNLGYGANKRKDDYALSLAGVIDSAVLNAMWTSPTSGGFHAGAPVNPAQPATMANLLNYANKRDMFTVGVGYQVTKQLNLGAHYYHAKQSGSASGAFNGKANFLVMAADYAFSKRTDAYFAVDHTKVSGGAGMALDSNGATSRTGITTGIRHRF